MTVTVEVPEGCKFCKSCGEVKPKDMFRMCRKANPSGSVSQYLDYRCKDCHRANVRAGHAKRAAGLVTHRPEKSRHLPPRPAYERACDTAFMQWRGGEPRQDWRVAL